MFLAPDMSSNSPGGKTQPTVQGIKIHIMEEGIEQVLKKKGKLESKRELFGFRIQIFSGPDRRNAYQAQSTFALQYPKTRSYLTYDGSNYKVRVGDFLFWEEAEQLRKKLYGHFNLTLIVKDKINFSLEPEAEQVSSAQP